MLVLALHRLLLIQVGESLSLLNRAHRSSRSRSFLLNETRRRGLTGILESTRAHQAAVEWLLLRRIDFVCFPPRAEVIFFMIPEAESAELGRGAARSSQPWSLCYQLCLKRLLRCLELLANQEKQGSTLSKIHLYLLCSELLLRIVICGALEERWLPQAKLAVLLKKALVHFEYSSSLLRSWLSHGINSVLHVNELELV